MAILKNALLGWLLIGGMVLYALALTAIDAGRRVGTLFASAGDDALAAPQR